MMNKRMNEEKEQPKELTPECIEKLRKISIDVAPYIPCISAGELEYILNTLDARDERIKELEALLRRVVEGLEPLNEVTNDGKKKIGWFKFMSSLKMLADLSEEIKKEVGDDTTRA